MLKILAHAAAIMCLYLAFSFVLFLGLQVNPVYGNIGLAQLPSWSRSTSTWASSGDSRAVADGNVR